jgi:hypothetical protein
LIIPSAFKVANATIQEKEKRVLGVGRWGDEEMGRWGDGEMGRWGDGEMGRINKSCLLPTAS